MGSLKYRKTRKIHKESTVFASAGFCCTCLGCRLPGNVNSPDQFWEIIKNGESVVTEIPSDRWNVEAFYNKGKRETGKMVSNRGGFIKDIDKFDHAFFKISPREAASMDPQQRHLLEVTYEAFEDAGIDPWGLQGDCGVFVGIGMMDYTILTCESNMMDAYSLTGVTHSVAANRLSYVFNFKGPSLTVDTACASSMTALHLACCALRNKECSVAVVGGCNNLLVPDISVGFSTLGVMSPDGQCCPFSSTAKGYVRSEGWGTLVLKPLDQAVNDEDHIYAVVRGSAIAASGYSSSLTKPSTSAQQDVMNEVYKRCNISLSSIDYVEAHGTGTPVGDPIEAEAIGKTFSPHRATPLKIGSVKGNFGHSECAAGVTAAIKVALMLEKQTLCPTVNFHSPNPTINFESLKLEVITKLEVLENGSCHRVAVNSFGFAGALAHVVFEQPPQHAEKVPRQCNWTFGGHKSGEHIIVPLSAKSNGALGDLVKKWISLRSALDALSVVSWLSTRRAHHDKRLAVICNSGSSFCHMLAKYPNSNGESGEETIVTQTSQANAQKVCFLFPGQGQQWSGMGQRLYCTEQIFHDTVQKCDDIFKAMSGTSLIQDIGLFQHHQERAISQLIDEIEVSQPAILFFQIGLIELWSHWGVHPDVVVGHSLGEVAAAYACGGLTIEEAVAVVYHRSTEQRKLKGTGSMAAVRKPLEEVEEMCSTHDGIYVAAVNGPRSITIAGQNEGIDSITHENPTAARKLRVQCAFHTSHMDAIKFSFERSISRAVQTRKRLKQVPFYSAVTGRRYNKTFGADYWWRNVRQPVQFQSAVECILNKEQPDVILELGSSETLLSSVRQIAGNQSNETNICTIASGKRNKDDRFSILWALGSLYVAGKFIKWENVTHKSAQWQLLPSYPWQHESHWKESEDRKKMRLGMEEESFKGRKGNFSHDKYPFLKDHVIQNQVIFPGAAYVEYLLQTCFNEDENPALNNVCFTKTLVWPDKEYENGDYLKGTVSLEVVQDGCQFQVLCGGESYCNAEVGNQRRSSPNSLPIDEIRLNLHEALDKEKFYRRLRKSGFQYGPAFQVVNQVLLGDGEVLGYLEAAPDKVQRIHTTILDGCLQLVIAALGQSTSLYIPIKIASFQMEVFSIPPGEQLVAHATVVDCDGKYLTGGVSLATKDGNVLASLQGVQAQAMGNREPKCDIQECLYTVAMQPLESCLNLSELKTSLREDDILTKYSGDKRVIEEAVKFIPENSACDGIDGTSNGEDISGQNIQRDSEKREISHDDEENATEDFQQALSGIKQDLSVNRSFENVPFDISETANVTKHQTLVDECWEKYPWNSFATKVHLRASASAIVQAIQEAFKQKSVIRVLMIGDRNTDLSNSILTHMREKGMKQKLDYTFSASSDSLFQNAQQHLKEFTFVKYKYLDVDNFTEEQGFVAESFDLVICLFTSHFTANTTESLLLLRRLLCQQGCLVIYEVVKLNQTAEPMGCLPSLFFHKNEICWLSNDEWEDIMTRSDFVDVVSVASHKCFPSIITGYKCRKEILPSSLPVRKQQITIIAKEGHPLAQVLEQFLENSRRVDNVSEGNEIHVDDKDAVPTKILVYIHSSSNMDHLSCLLTFFQEVNMALSIKSLWFLTCGASEHHRCQDMEGSAALGLTRVIANSIHKFPVFSVDVDPAASHERNAFHVCSLLTDPPPDHEIVIDDDRCLVPRVLPLVLRESKNIQTRKWKIGLRKSDNAVKRSVDDLHFLASETMQLEDDHVLVEVKSAGLNFKDVMNSMGMLEKLNVSDGKEGFGLECSGIVTDKGNSVEQFKIGDEVIVFATSCLASHVKCSQEHVILKPQNLNWNESAGVGIVFTTAFYCLVERAGLKEGETVLIHSACGGVGLAAVQVAQMIGANVICSAGTEEKRTFLEEAMAIKYVTDSRSEKFYNDVMKWTDKQGVDVVLNSLRGDLMRKSLTLLSHGGRFCEIGKRDILENSQVPMQSLLENKSFLSCHVDILLSQKPKMFMSCFENVSKLLMNNTLQPIKTTVRPISAFKETFRMMSKGRHIGKIVLDVSSEPIPMCVQNASEIFEPNATYIITGGFGGIGLALSRWMCKKGAKHLVLTSRQGCHNAAGRRTLAFLRSQGVTVYEFAGDLSEELVVQAMVEKLNQSSSIPPIRGVFHLAGVITEEDNFHKLRPDQLKLVFGSKARSAQLLHDHTLDQPVDKFLLISSVATVWGNPAQPSYCAANSYLDALAHHRHSLGLPALSLQLGAVRGAGFLEDKSEVTQRLADKGILTLHIDEILSILGKLLESCDEPVVCLANQVGILLWFSSKQSLVDLQLFLLITD